MDPYQITIIGLGNYPAKYKNTPHNAGFVFLDALAVYLKKLPHTAINTQKTKLCKQYTYVYPFVHVYILYPLTYMNLVHKCILSVATLLGESTAIIVAHDDLDIPLGKYKISKGKTTKSHNGVKSLASVIELTNVYFVRLGVDIPRRRQLFKQPADYLLTPFKKPYIQILSEAAKTAASEIVERFIHPYLKD